MRTVSITEAKQNVSRLVKDVEAGETVVITRRGKPVAELEPYKASKLDDPERRAAFARWSKYLRERKDDGYRVGKITEEDKYGDIDL